VHKNEVESKFNASQTQVTNLTKELEKLNENIKNIDKMYKMQQSNFEELQDNDRTLQRNLDDYRLRNLERDPLLLELHDK